MAERDIDMVLITGAGASAPFGVNGTTLAMMGQWSDVLVREINLLGPSHREATGLEMGLAPEDFEQRLGQFLRSVAAFEQIEALIGPSAEFQHYRYSLVRDSLKEWHSGTAHHLRQIADVVNRTLYVLFGDPKVDLDAAASSYGNLLQQLGVQPTGSRWVYATTNYDTIGERVIDRLGGMPDWGQPPPLDYRNQDKLDVNRLIDGMPRYVPVLHLHGRVGWFRREDGQIYGTQAATYTTGIGVPLVMLPDPVKDYSAEPVIQSIWQQFEETLRRAKRVFILGHSLHDTALVEALKAYVQPSGRVAVSVLAREDDLRLPVAECEQLAKFIQQELLATVVPLRFGMPLSASVANAVQTWVNETSAV